MSLSSRQIAMEEAEAFHMAQICGCPTWNRELMLSSQVGLLRARASMIEASSPETAEEYRTLAAEMQLEYDLLRLKSRRG